MNKFERAFRHAGDERMELQAAQNEIHFLKADRPDRAERIAQIKRQIRRNSGEIRSAWRDALRREEEV